MVNNSYGPNRCPRSVLKVWGLHGHGCLTRTASISIWLWAWISLEISLGEMRLCSFDTAEWTLALLCDAEAKWLTTGLGFWDPVWVWTHRNSQLRFKASRACTIQLFPKNRGFLSWDSGGDNKSHASLCAKGNYQLVAIYSSHLAICIIFWHITIFLDHITYDLSDICLILITAFKWKF